MDRAPFGHWLKAQRRVRKLTQAGLEAAAGLGDNYVSKVERGELRLPGEDVRERIHRALGTTDDDLVRAGILERIDTPGYEPVYVPAAHASSQLAAVTETNARFDEADARLRLRLLAETLTETQAAALLAIIEAFESRP